MPFFEDHPEKGVPSVVSLYSQMLNEIAGAVSGRLNSEKSNAFVSSGCFGCGNSANGHITSSDGKYILSHSVVLERRRLLLPSVYTPVAHFKNFMFGDEFDIAELSLDRALTEDDFKPENRRLEVRVRELGFEPAVRPFVEAYSALKGFKAYFFYI